MRTDRRGGGEQGEGGTAGGGRQRWGERRGEGVEGKLSMRRGELWDRGAEADHVVGYCMEWGEGAWETGCIERDIIVFEGMVWSQGSRDR